MGAHELGTATVFERDDLDGVEVAGEVDLAVADDVGSWLGEHIADAGDADVVVDVRHLSFIDVTGCRVLVEIARQLPAGRHLVLVNAPRHLVRTLELCEWLDCPQLRVVPEAAAAAEA